MTYRCPLCKRTFTADVPPTKNDYCGYRGRIEADEPAPETQPSPVQAHSVRVSDAVLELAS